MAILRGKNRPPFGSFTNKNRTIAEVGRRTRLRNHDIQKILEALIEVWLEELAQEGRIELENFPVLEVRCMDRGENAGSLLVGGKRHHAPRFIHQLSAKRSKRLRTAMKNAQN